ncbi:hypothetical protein AGR3A_Cc170190 [Agrobacterium tomkonis CFBP 6623]|uniref:Uncharacterized protein n=1 Tax=Agrobacterium tomkonis CFBP 6623 TaxID=1183432 RepID=A0A1S7NW59_9HYPH|nr:hypothetical protein AGR3A_Cc170190 [Agrobacterium tomkonis CFBP 6623]
MTGDIPQLIDDARQFVPEDTPGALIDTSNKRHQESPPTSSMIWPAPRDSFEIVWSSAHIAGRPSRDSSHR